MNKNEVQKRVLQQRTKYVMISKLNKTFEEELTSDIVSLMASFSARLYGKRSSKNREKNENK